MSGDPQEVPRRVWVDPRFRELVAGWDRSRVEHRPGGRPRRVCPHGFGVTVMVDPESHAPRNVQCGACYAPGA
ncbi:hypothetical protein [Streptomyces sp. NPDC047718]|uniref:hypothetical protein n=1 Tax=Streptomyces sp. NPDC047718 TaxID=3155479 RepID=UPI0033F2C342